MMRFSRRTRRLYYEDSYLAQARTRIVQVGPTHIELEATVAYPEGGGQEPDHGVITLPDGRRLRFHDVRRLYGHPCGLAEFPDVQVDGVIWHQIVPEDQPLLEGLHAGMPAQVEIDTQRRTRLSLSHTASHVLYLAIARHRPDAIARTLGCHIREDGARFDFAVDERFTPEALAAIEQEACAMVARDAPITFSAHPQAPDARRWHCEGQVIPCGGTHLESTGAVGPISVRRKRLGAGKERIACAFPLARPPFERFHGGT